MIYHIPIYAKAGDSNEPPRVLLLDHPNRYDKVFAVDGREFGTHAEDGAVSTGNGCFVQMGKSTNQLVARINRSFDFQRMQHTVALDDHIDLVAVAVTIIPQ